MTREEAKEILLNRGFIDGIYDGNKWREACIVISKWLEQEPILDKINELAKFAIESTGQSDAYSHGMCNGIEYMRATLTDTEPHFLDANYKNDSVLEDGKAESEDKE